MADEGGENIRMACDSHNPCPIPPDSIRAGALVGWAKRPGHGRVFMTELGSLLPLSLRVECGMDHVGVNLTTSNRRGEEEAIIGGYIYMCIVLFASVHAATRVD